MACALRIVRPLETKPKPAAGLSSLCIYLKDSWINLSKSVDVPEFPEQDHIRRMKGECPMNKFAIAAALVTVLGLSACAQQEEEVIMVEPEPVSEKY